MALAPLVQARFEALRRRHFPPARNRVPAHATLFHALPPDGAEVAAETLGRFGRTPVPILVTGVRSLGRGVAFTLAGDDLRARRDAVAHAFAGRLTRQDGARWQPHVTVQNKVSPAEAAAVLRTLADGFVPVATEAAAFHLWRYRGGPWEPVWSMAVGAGAEDAAAR